MVFTPPFRVSLFAIVFLLALTSAVHAQPSVSKDKFFVFVGMGHSNMAGRSKQYDTQTHPRCWMYKDGKWKLAKEIVQGWGGGPAMPFLKKLAALYPDYHFGWIGTAASSLMIRDYHRGKSRYNTALNLAKKAQNVGTVAGVLTMLGMQEGRQSKSTESTARSVCEDFQKLITDFRADIGIGDLPLLVGRYEESSERYLSGGSDAKWADIVIREIREVPSKVSRCKVIESDGPYDDDHHFNYTGHKRWSETAANLIKNNGYLPQPGPSDDTPPTVPSGLQATDVTYNSVSLSWNASTDDATGVEEYEVYRGTTRIGATSSTSYTATALAPSTEYAFKVRAVDGAGNASAFSNAVTVTTSELTDNDPPTTPTGLSSPAQTINSIELTWDASTDNIGISGYEVFLDGELRAHVSGTSTTVHNLSPATQYAVTLRAEDVGGNVSPFSGALNVSTREPSYATLPLKVNIGGPAAQGFAADKEWADGQDHGYLGTPAATWWGRTHTDEWRPTDGTELDTVYQYVRHDGNWGYRVAVPPGYYTVTMLFAEYWRDADGTRVFEVRLNGNTIPQSPIDIYAAAGQATAYDITWTGVVPDGLLSIDVEGLTSNGMMNGLVVEKTPAYEITYPTGGETFTVGQQITITWNTNPLIDNAVVEVSPNDGENWVKLVENSIAPDDPDWENFPFTIPSELDGLAFAGSANCLVRIRDYDNLNHVRLAAPFSVAPAAVNGIGAALDGHRPLRVAARGDGLSVRWAGREDLTVNIVATDGRLVAQAAGDSRGVCNLRLPTWSAGIYLVRIESEGASIERRLIRH